MLQILKDISGNRMPSVADLLKQAAQAPNVGHGHARPATRRRWPARSAPAAAGKPAEAEADGKKTPPSVPQIVDRESSQQPPPTSRRRTRTPAQEQAARRPGSRLPVTTARRARPRTRQAARRRPAEQKVDEAVEQAAGPAGRVREDRRRAEPRPGQPRREHAGQAAQGRLAAPVQDRRPDRRPARRRPSASAASRSPAAPAKVLGELAEQEAQGQPGRLDDHGRHAGVLRAPAVRPVQDGARRDAEAGRHRQPAAARRRRQEGERRVDRPVRILVGHARPLGRRPGRPGVQRHVPGRKSQSSLPPSIVLEVLQILEAEVNLREETRVAEQAQPARQGRGAQAAGRQALRAPRRASRTASRRSPQQIRELPDGESRVRQRDRAARPGLGGDGRGDRDPRPARRPAARPSPPRPRRSSCCCKSKRINPKGGGGGGSTPGGGGSGTTNDSALALLGGGVNEKEVREDRGVSQATGDSGPVAPRGVPRRPGRVLQPARTRPRHPLDPTRDPTPGRPAYRTVWPGGSIRREDPDETQTGTARLDARRRLPADFDLDRHRPGETDSACGCASRRTSESREIQGACSTGRRLRPPPGPGPPGFRGRQARGLQSGVETGGGDGRGHAQGTSHY